MKGLGRGLLLFIVVVAAVGVWEFLLRPAIAPGEARSGGGFASIFSSTVEVSGLIGSEKANFLENLEVQEILKERYGLTVAFRKAGSFEMLDLSHDGLDFLWPSSQVALEKYREDYGATIGDAVIFNSPIVFYSWWPIVNALERKGLVQTEGEVRRAGLAPLLEAIRNDTSWSQLGVDAVFGAFGITSTDPLRSNSGNMYAGLVANTLSGGVVDDRSLDAVRPEVVEVFRRQGQMEHSTGTLFERYLQLGMAQFPLIVGYESQYIEFARENPDLWPEVREEIALVYPVPTVWSSHPLIALSEEGRTLIEALQDEEIQRIAWQRHGFRSGALGSTNDPTELGIDRVASEVTQVIQMPRPAVMFSIMDAIEGGRGTTAPSDGRKR